MPRFQGFIGPAYKLRAVNAACQRAVGLFPEIYEQGTGKDGERALLVPSPGLVLKGTVGDGPGRGIYRASDGTCVAAIGGLVVSIATDGTTTTLGSLRTTTGPVGFSDNGLQLIIVDGDAGYIWTKADGTWAQIADFPAAGCTQVAYLDGSFLAIEPNSQKVYYSDLMDGASWPALNFFSAESIADNLVGIAVVHQQIWLMGSQSTEVFYDSGAADAPFQRVQGAVIAHGCAAPASIGILDNALFWLGDGANGEGVVWKMVGYVPTRISDHAVEDAIQSYGSLAGSVAWTYQEDGHHFYCLQIPGAPTMWVYDVASNSWHERVWLNLSGVEEAHRGIAHAFAGGIHWVLDRENGSIYQMTQDAATDAGRPIVRERTAPQNSADMHRVFFSLFQLDAQVGVGLDGEGTGNDPNIGLSWSDDGGNTWFPYRWRSMGKIGQFTQRIIWRCLGQSRFRVFRVRTTEPVRVTLLGARVEAIAGGPC